MVAATATTASASAAAEEEEKVGVAMNDESDAGVELGVNLGVDFAAGSGPFAVKRQVRGNHSCTIKRKPSKTR